MAAPLPVLLLPPSERKAPGGSRRSWGDRPTTFEQLRAARSQVAAAAGIAADGPSLPALQRYTGVLYDALDVGGMPAGLRRRASANVLIVSGLAGLVSGGDPVPAYTLPIGTVVPGLGGLASWWRPRLSAVLDARVAGAVVWDLLPAAHAAAWTPGGSWRVRWRVRVLREDPRTGARQVVSHDNKTAKGALARLVLTTGARGPAALVGWEGPGGYALDPGSSAYTRSGGVLDLVRRG